MPFQKYVPWNNAQGQLIAGISAGSPTFILQSWQGDRFPSTFPFLVEIKNVDVVAPYAVLKREIHKVTNRVGDTFTSVRSAGTCLPDDASNTPGTTAFSFSTGDIVTLTVTAETIKDIQDEVALKLPTIGGLRTGMLTAQNIWATNGSPNITVADTTGWANGATIAWTGIPGGTTILSFVANTSAILSANFTGATWTVSATVGYKQLSEYDATGLEVKRPISASSSLLSTELFQKINPSTRAREEVTYATIKNDIWTAGKYIQNVSLWEALEAQWYGSSVVNAFTLSWGASGTYATMWGRVQFGIRTKIISVKYPYNASNGSASIVITMWTAPFTVLGTYPVANGTKEATGINFVCEPWVIYQIGCNSTVNFWNLHNNWTLTASDIEKGFISWCYANSNFDTTWRLEEVVIQTEYPGLNAIAIVDKISYRNVLASSAWANQIRAGIRVNVPYPCKIRNIKTWQTTSSSSASILILDATGATLQTIALTIGQQVVDLNYTFAPNTEYRIVLNDTANWTSGSTYAFSTIATFQSTFPYIVGSVYWAWAWTLVGASWYIFTELELDFELKAFKARANRVIESEFAMFSWFAIWPKSSWDSVTLDNNNQSYISWANFSKKGIYYVSNTAWYIHYVKWTIESVVWYADSLTSIIAGWQRPKRVQLISDSYAWVWFSLPRMFTWGEFDYTLTNNSVNTTYLQWSSDKADWTDIDSWSAVSSTSWKGMLPRGYFRVYNPVSTTWSYTIT